MRRVMEVYSGFGAACRDEHYAQARERREARQAWAQGLVEGAPAEFEMLDDALQAGPDARTP